MKRTAIIFTQFLKVYHKLMNWKIQEKAPSSNDPAAFLCQTQNSKSRKTELKNSYPAEIKHKQKKPRSQIPQRLSHICPTFPYSL